MTTTSTPTIKQFLSQPYDPEEDEHDVEPFPAGQHADPLERIAHTLDRMLAIAEHHELEESEADRFREAHADLSANHDVLLDLVEEISAIVKPSTSKLANTVREAIARWSDPQVPAEPADEAPAEPAATVEPVRTPAAVHAIGEGDLVGACGQPGPTTNAAGYVTCPECLTALSAQQPA